MSLTAGQIHIINDAKYNAMLLETFLCGLYTLLFWYTLPILLQRGKRNLSATLALLWVVVITTFSLDWWYHRSAYIDHNSSPLDTAAFLNRISRSKVDQSLFIADNIFSVSSNWLADAILIWRCYVLWEHKKWMLSPLPILLIADIAIPCATYFSTVANNPRLDSIFVAIFFSISTTITVIGTSLIILRILVVAVQETPGFRLSAYSNIQRIILESCILYSAAMVLASISILLQLTQHNEKLVSIAAQLTEYSGAALVPLSGIGPTLTAARVAHEASQPAPNATQTLSHLTFRRSARRNQSTADTDDGFVPHMRFESIYYATPEEGPTHGPGTRQAQKDAHQDHDEKSSSHDSAEKIV